MCDCDRVGPIIMEVGVPVANASSLLKLALGVEQCQCTEQYSGLSCQVTVYIITKYL